MKEFADDNFELDENEKKYSKLEENTVGKGEIARNVQFLLFPQCFQKTYTAGLFGKGLIMYLMIFACIITSQWIYWHLEPLEERIVVINFFPDRVYSGPDSGENGEQSQNNIAASKKECR